MREVLEPHLKYEGLGGDVSSITASGDEVTCLCLSDKILAVGTARGNVHVLDYSGNEVRDCADHGREQRHHAWRHDVATGGMAIAVLLIITILVCHCVPVGGYSSTMMGLLAANGLDLPME